MRLIDADKIDKELENWKQGQTDTNSYDMVNHFQGIIRNAPTVKERKHGHWNYSRRGGHQCSECKRSSKNGSPFCQWCGAIMDEVSKDE